MNSIYREDFGWDHGGNVQWEKKNVFWGTSVFCCQQYEMSQQRRPQKSQASEVSWKLRKDSALRRRGWFTISNSNAVDILSKVLTENCEVFLGHWQLNVTLFKHLPHITPCSPLHPAKPVLCLRLWPHALDWGSMEVFLIPESRGKTSPKLELSPNKKTHCDLDIILRTSILVP